MRRGKVARIDGLGILEQLWVEEALLVSRKRSWDSFVLVNAPFLAGGEEKHHPGQAVIGLGQSPAKVLHAQAVVQDAFPVVQRYTAGGAVVVDPHVVYASWLGSREYLVSSLRQQPLPGELMHAATPLLAAAWRRWADVGTNHYDYVIGPRKVGGIAQRVFKDTWAHHVSFLWRANVPWMERYLVHPDRTPEYRGSRSHRDFVTDFSSVLAEPPHAWANVVDGYVDALVEYQKTSQQILVEHVYSKEEFLRELPSFLDLPDQWKPRSSLMVCDDPSTMNLPSSWSNLSTENWWSQLNHV